MATNEDSPRVLVSEDIALINESMKAFEEAFIDGNEDKMETQLDFIVSRASMLREDLYNMLGKERP